MPPVMLTCPSCGATLKSARPLAAGTAVRCTKCARPFRVPDGEGPGPEALVEEEETSRPSKPAPRPERSAARGKRPTEGRHEDDEEGDERSARQRDRRPTEEDDERPARKRSQKKVNAPLGLLIAAAVVGGILVLGGGGVGLYFLLRAAPRSPVAVGPKGDGKQAPQPGPGGETDPRPQAGLYESPQAVMDAYNRAEENGDHKSRHNCFSPAGQREDARQVVSGGWPYLRNLATANSPEALAAAKQEGTHRLDVMAKHGLTVETTKHLLRYDSGDRREREKIRGALFALIRDPATFSLEFRTAAEKDQGRVSFKAGGFTVGRLTGVRIDGDKATGNLPLTMEGGIQTRLPIEFVKIEGSWKIARFVDP